MGVWQYGWGSFKRKGKSGNVSKKLHLNHFKERILLLKRGILMCDAYLPEHYPMTSSRKVLLYVAVPLKVLQIVLVNKFIGQQILG